MWNWDENISPINSNIAGSKLSGVDSRRPRRLSLFVWFSVAACVSLQSLKLMSNLSKFMPANFLMKIARVRALIFFFLLLKSVIYTEISGIQIHVPGMSTSTTRRYGAGPSFFEVFPFVFDACSCHVEEKRCNTWNEFAVETDSSLKSVLQLPMTVAWPRGLMDKAPASGAGDCGFESRRGRYFAHIETFFFIPTVGLQFISAKCPW